MPEYVYQIVVEETRGTPQVEYLTNRNDFTAEEFKGIVRSALWIVCSSTKKTDLVDIAVDLFKYMYDHYGFTRFIPRASYKLDSTPL